MRLITADEIGYGGSQVGYYELPEYILAALVSSGGRLGVPVPGIETKLDIMAKAPARLGIKEQDAVLIRHPSLLDVFPLPEGSLHREITGTYLSRNRDILEILAPQLICIEAASMFRSARSGRAMALESYITRHPDTRLLVMGRQNPVGSDLYSRLSQ